MIERSDIPSHWQLKKLGEVGNCVTGNTPPKNDSSNYGDEVPFIKPPQLTDRIVFDAPEKLSLKGSKKSRLVPPNSVLVTCIGNLGRTAINKIPVAFNQQINAIVPNEKLDGRFLFYQAQSPFFKNQLEGLSAATTVAIVNKGKFETIKVVVPPLPEQQAIVAKIEELFSELENGKQQLLTAQQQLKVYRQSLLKWAFEGKLTNKNVKEGELPKGWKFEELKNVCVIKRGKSKHRPRNEPGLFGGKYPFIQTGDIREANGGFIKKYSQTYSEIGLQQSKLWPKGTLCITIAANIGETAILDFDACFPDSVVGLISDEKILLNKYTNYFFISHKSKLEKLAPATAQKNINVDILEKVRIPLPPIEEQQLIVSELESKLTVCDKIEETISQSLQQAETLKQSILKKAFEGRLVPTVAEQRKTKVIPLYKPKNEYFYQMQLLGIVAKASKQKQIEHGEMTLAKYAYLMDKVYDVPTYFNYNRWHLGPYPPTIKKVINNKQYFKKLCNHIEVLNEKTLFNSTNPNTEKMQSAVNDLTDIFSKYNTKERSHKTELLATVCKVIEDIQSTDLKAVRQSMLKWKINLKGEKHKTKAEKFNEPETEKCLAFIKEKGWDKKLMK